MGSIVTPSSLHVHLRETIYVMRHNAEVKGRLSVTLWRSVVVAVSFALPGCRLLHVFVSCAVAQCVLAHVCLSLQIDLLVSFPWNGKGPGLFSGLPLSPWPMLFLMALNVNKD